MDSSEEGENGTKEHESLPDDALGENRAASREKKAPSRKGMGLVLLFRQAYKLPRSSPGYAQSTHSSMSRVISWHFAMVETICWGESKKMVPPETAKITF